jgi:hypothetical protein
MPKGIGYGGRAQKAIGRMRSKLKTARPVGRAKVKASRGSSGVVVGKVGSKAGAKKKRAIASASRAFGAQRIRRDAKAGENRKAVRRIQRKAGVVDAKAKPKSKPSRPKTKVARAKVLRANPGRGTAAGQRSTAQAVRGARGALGRQVRRQVQRARPVR